MAVSRSQEITIIFIIIIITIVSLTVKNDMNSNKE